MRKKTAAALVILGMVVTFDACMQAEYAMIWRDAFLMQSGFGMLLAVIGLFAAGVFSRHDEDEAEAEQKEKRRP